MNNPEDNTELNDLGELNNARFAEQSKLWKNLTPEQIEQSTQGSDCERTYYNGDVMFWTWTEFQEVLKQHQTES